jgi:spermidine/putrescine-binding protein
MMNNPQVIVALNNISKISDGKRILTQLDLETYDGESLTLQSTSSGGKSTLQRPDVAAKVAEAIDYPSPVKDATPLLTPAFRNNPMVFPSYEIKRKGEFQSDVGDAFRLYEQYFLQLKAMVAKAG